MKKVLMAKFITGGGNAKNYRKVRQDEKCPGPQSRFAERQNFKHTLKGRTTDQGTKKDRPPTGSG